MSGLLLNSHYLIVGHRRAGLTAVIFLRKIERVFTIISLHLAGVFVARGVFVVDALWRPTSRLVGLLNSPRNN